MMGNSNKLNPTCSKTEQVDHTADNSKKVPFLYVHEYGLISRQAAIDAVVAWTVEDRPDIEMPTDLIGRIKALPSAQSEQRYTEEELSVFAHGISLSLLSKRSAQHWRYDEDRATEIEFLERLYEKVGADMRGEQDG